MKMFCTKQGPWLESELQHDVPVTLFPSIEVSSLGHSHLAPYNTNSDGELHDGEQLG
jgi:hypothetical protein